MKYCFDACRRLEADVLSMQAKLVHAQANFLAVLLITFYTS